MLQRGLLPYFSHEALAELDKIQLPPTIESAKAYDLRELLWSSIDNDDSLDLDQLTVAEAMSGDRVKLRRRTPQQSWRGMYGAAATLFEFEQIQLSISFFFFLGTLLLNVIPNNSAVIPSPTVPI